MTFKSLLVSSLLSWAITVALIGQRVSITDGYDLFAEESGQNKNVTALPSSDFNGYIDGVRYSRGVRHVSGPSAFGDIISLLNLFRGSYFDRINNNDGIIKNDQIRSGQNLANTVFTGVIHLRRDGTENHLADIVVDHVLFDDSVFEEVIVDKVEFNNCSFRNVIFHGFRGCEGFNDCDFTGAIIHTDESQPGKLTDLATSNNSYKDFCFRGGMLVNEVPLNSEALRQTASFKMRNLSGSGLFSFDKDMSNFNLIHCKIGKIPEDCNFDNTIIRGADFDKISLKQIYSTYDYKQGRLIDVVFNYCDFTNGKFTNMNLSGISFRYCHLTNADFTNSKISWASFAGNSTEGNHIKINQIKSTADFKNKKLYHVSLSEVDFSNVDLSGFDLTGCCFNRCNLDNVNFTDAVITDCDCNVYPSEKSYSILHKINIEQVKSTWNYKNGYMRGISLPSDIQKALEAEKNHQKK
ncbi:MAG: pentapeptide repeat-containing protein [Planctomycetaceae bacterium]|jgi:uncharacterized protein YjbI with pentapeptide repeats|nr:pentapeptide repeat-containing protein [Planctomycetaceae bacterium]